MAITTESSANIADIWVSCWELLVTHRCEVVLDLILVFQYTGFDWVEGCVFHSVLHGKVSVREARVRNAVHLIWELAFHFVHRKVRGSFTVVPIMTYANKNMYSIFNKKNACVDD